MTAVVYAKLRIIVTENIRTIGPRRLHCQNITDKLIFLGNSITP